MITKKEKMLNKADQLAEKYFPDSQNIWARSNIEAQKVKYACIEMTEWLEKDMIEKACGIAKDIFENKPEIMTMWIARRKSSKLYMFFEKPHLTEDGKQWFVLKNIPNNGVFADMGIKIDENKFPEVTFENSPMEVEVKLIEK